MRSVGLDLGARHIAYCEVRDGKVVDRVAVRSLEELSSRLGPGAAPARVAFEAAREAWHVHDTLKGWGHEPKIVDTTRPKTIGVGQHKRKTRSTPSISPSRWTRDVSPKPMCSVPSDARCARN
jgi:transposase